jgi:cyclase
LRSGADKVSINTAAINNPDFIEAAANRFGSSTIVVAIEAIKSGEGKYLAYTDNGREHTGIDVFDWALEAEKRGAGELIITSVDREGTGDGFDIELVRKISSLVSIPIIAHGGAGNYQDCLKVIENANLDGISIASLLHYSSYRDLSKKIDGAEGNTLFASKGLMFHKFKEADLPSLKLFLSNNNIPIRL